MTRFGDWKWNVDWGPRQGFMWITPNYAIPVNANITFTIGTYTMPFDGSLFAEFKCRCSWTNDQNYFRAWLNGSTPAPTTHTEHCKWGGAPNGWPTDAEVPMSARWDSLTAGTAVTLNGFAGTGNLGGIVVAAMGGIYRAYPI